MGEVGRVTAQAFDRVLGERLLSVRAVGVSVSYSIAASMLGFLCAVALYQGSHSSWPFLPVYVPLMSICAFLGSLPLFAKNLRVVNGLYAVLLGGVFLYLVSGGGRISFEQLKHPWTLLRFSAFSSLIILSSFACDVLYVLWSRWSLRWGSRRVHFWSIAAIVALNCTLAFSLAIGPFWCPTTRINSRAPPLPLHPH